MYAGYYLLVVKISATAAAATASRTIRRAVCGQPARAARPISVINRPKGLPLSSTAAFLIGTSDGALPSAGYKL